MSSAGVLVEFVKQRKQQNCSQLLIVAVAGPPGSGKTTLVEDACAALNASGFKCLPLPMDGFHYYKRQLDEMEDVALAYKRRGASWTFDFGKYAKCVESIKRNGQGSAPSFDHAVGDPIESAYKFDATTQVILTEGNYLLLDEAPWSGLASSDLFDVCVFLQCDIDVAMERVMRRHMKTMNLSEADARLRVDTNDRLNAQQILNKRVARCDLLLDSSN